MAKSVSPWKLRQQPPELRCCTFDRPDGAFCYVVGEDVQVRAGGDAEDEVLERQEPAGDAAGVFGGGGAAVQVRGQPGGRECPVAADEVLQDGGFQGRLPGRLP
jgi:hypothetical protein